MYTLRYHTLNRIRQKFPDLIRPQWVTNLDLFILRLKDRDSGLIIIGLVISFFSIFSIINLTFINHLNFSIETLKALVDQRTTNIATIISITLVVVGFLINNLALKEPFAYRLLFKHSYLYTILYLTLSTIGCFVVISTLKDYIDLYPKLFSALILSGTYLVIIILFCIALIFKTIINFADVNEIEKILQNELLEEGRRNIYSRMVRRYSADIFKDWISNKNVIEFDLMMAMNFFELKNSSVSSSKELPNKTKKIIFDVDMLKISQIIAQKNHKHQLYFENGFSLDFVTTEYDNYIWSREVSNTKAERNLLKSSLKFKKVDIQKNSINNTAIREYFDGKLKDLANGNKYRLEALLDSYLELYKLQMKYDDRR